MGAQAALFKTTKLWPAATIKERVKRPRTSKVVLDKKRETQHKVFTKTVAEKILCRQLSAEPKFRLRIDNFEKAVPGVQNEIERVVFDTKIAATPYIRSFTDMGFKLRKIKRPSSCTTLPAAQPISTCATTTTEGKKKRKGLPPLITKI